MENLSDDKEREQKHSFRPIFKHICWLEAKFPAWGDRQAELWILSEIETGLVVLIPAKRF